MNLLSSRVFSMALLLAITVAMPTVIKAQAPMTEIKLSSATAGGGAATQTMNGGAVTGLDGDVEMKPDQVQSKLQGTATDIGTKGYDQYFGYGRIDALRAIGG